jgi:integrase
VTETTRAAIQDWLKAAGLTSSDYLFPSRLSESPNLSIRQYARLLKAWLRRVGLDPVEYGTHSIRRTKATLIYRRTGNLRAVQLLLADTKLETTVRYLGVEVDDALALAEQTEI